MTKQKYFFIPLTLFSSALCLELIILPSLLTKVKAQSELVNKPETISSTLLANVTFDPPKDGKPDDTAGGASRRRDYPLDGYITALTPYSNNGLTVSERPTFLFYLPETSAKEIFFSLQDEDKNYFYQTKIPIIGKSGIVRFQLPNDAPSLEIGKNYQWTFILVSRQGLNPDSTGVQGKIQRVAANPIMLSQLQNRTLLERAALYGKNGIWFETIMSLAEARRTQPKDTNIVTNWQELLKSVGLEAIATQPLLN